MVEKICVVVAALIVFGFSGWGLPLDDASAIDNPGESGQQGAQAEGASNKSMDGIKVDGSGDSQNGNEFKPWDGKWSLTPPEGQGFNGVSLNRAVDTIGEMKGVYSLLVVRNHFLVVERYFREGSRTKPHNLKSATKSILSALVGIGVDQGLLRTDQVIGDFLPQVNRLGDQRKRYITVRHLLTMTSGLEQTSYQAYNSWVSKGDWVKTILNKPLSAAPGTLHQYSTGDAHILSAVLTAATGMGLKDYADKYLFDPMGIKVYGWGTDPTGIQQGGNNLSLIPRDMAKIGQLYLDKGLFGNRRIVPEWWVEVSTRPNYLGSHGIYGYYGYLWYTRPGGKNDFVAVGYGGQYIYVSPLYNSVVVVTSTLESKGSRWEKKLFDTIQNHLLAGIDIPEGQQDLVSNGRPDVKGRFDGGDGNREASGGIQKGIVLSNLNLRKGPETSEPKLLMLEPGTVLEIIERIDSWLKVSAGKELGWVAADYVRIVSPDSIAFGEPKIDTRNEVAEEALETGIPLPETSEDDVNAAAESASLKAVSLKLENRLDNHESRLQQFKGALNSLQNDWAGQRQSVMDLGAVWGSLTSDMGGVQSRMGVLGEAVDGSKVAVEFQKKEISAIRDKLIRLSSDMDAGLKQDQEQQDQLRDDLGGLKKELAAQQFNINGIRSAGAGHESAITGFREQLGGEISELRSHLDGLKGRLEKQQDLLGQDLILGRESIKVLEKKIQSLEAEQQDTALSLKGLDNALARQKESRTQLSDLGGRQAILTETVEKLQQSWDHEKNKTFAGVYGQLISLGVAVKKEEDQRNSLEARVEKEIKGLSRDFETAVKEAAGPAPEASILKQELASARQEITDLKTQLEDATIRMNRLSMELVRTKKEFEELRRAPVLISVETQRRADLPSQAEIQKPTADTAKALMQKKIEAFVASWAEAWEKQDVDTYLSLYSETFKPSKGMSLAKWSTQRKKRILQPKDINITVTGIKPEVVDASHGRATFTQIYRSSLHGDTAVKTLELVWEKEGWKILSENSKKP